MKYFYQILLDRAVKISLGFWLTKSDKNIVDKIWYSEFEVSSSTSDKCYSDELKNFITWLMEIYI